MITLPIKAQEGKIDDLFAELLAIPADQAAQSVRIVEQITAAWAKSGSASMDLLLKRGEDALKEGDIQAAIDHFSALVDHAPDFAEGYNARAQAYFSAGYYGPALADLRAALALNPRHFGAMAGIAIIQQEAGARQKALETYRKVLELNPNDEDVLKAVSNLEGVAL
ncbi:tetratricopeptide repeat protein [Profundibacter sp.]